MFRKGAFRHTFAAILLTLTAGMPLLAADFDSDEGRPAYVPVDMPRADAAAAATAQTVPFSDKAIHPGRYDGDVRHLPESYLPPSYFHQWNEFPEPEHSVKLDPKTLPKSAPAPATPTDTAPMPSPLANFDGLALDSPVTGGRAGSSLPPDTNIDVGPTYVIEGVNDAWGIFDKSTGSLVAAFTENALWAGARTGTPCDNSNQGDSVVIHDAAADRWILTNFAFAVVDGKPQAPFYECLAVSQTSDPVKGGWYFYAVRTDSGSPGGPPQGMFVDYPKFGIWTNCLFMGANGFDDGLYSGPVFAAFDRAALFNGTPLDARNSSIGFLFSSDTYSMFPANLLGGANAAAQPPAGRNAFFVSASLTIEGFDVRQFHPGLTPCGSGATLTPSVFVDTLRYALPESPERSTDIVPQRGTSTKLDSLGSQLMQRVGYRRLGSTESIWVVHTTCGPLTLNSLMIYCSVRDRLQPHWVQLDVTGGVVTPVPMQEQFYAFDQTRSRWVPSLAVDQNGNLALGYNTASGIDYPSIAYSGRLYTDPPDSLPRTEVNLIEGGGSQTSMTCSGGPCMRWGDYSAMVVDPVDDCTFWFASQYYSDAAHGASLDWQTRIGAFKFPTCKSIGLSKKLAFTQPPDLRYEPYASIAVQVSVQDAAGNVVVADNSNVSLTLVALDDASTGTLRGATDVTARNSVAGFPDLYVDQPGKYALLASDGSLDAAQSAQFTITNFPIARIAFGRQPTNVTAGATTSVSASVLDIFNHPVSGESVTLALANNPGGATLHVDANPVATVGGTALFSGISLDKPGVGYTLKVTDTNNPSISAISDPFDVVQNTGAASIAFTTEPSDSPAGATIPIAVRVLDARGNPVSGDNITLAFGSNTCNGTLHADVNPVMTNGNGYAVFSNVSVNKACTGYTLQASDASIPALTATSTPFNIAGSVPANISFSTQPSTTAVGVTSSVAVRVLDASGNPKQAEAITLSLATNPGGAALGVADNPVATDANGIAVFFGISLNKAGTGYQLKATDQSTPTLTATSATFKVLPAPPTSIVFLAPPMNAQAGDSIPVAVQVKDAGGKGIAGDAITLSIANNPSAATLSASVNPVTTDSNGNAEFFVALDKVGSGYTLQATDSIVPTLTATSTPFDIRLGAPASLTFSTPPANTAAGTSFAVAVRVQDKSGNPISADAVTLALANNPGGATLNVTQNPVATSATGVAQFSVSLNKPGSGYTLLATDASNPALSATSAAFDVSVGPAATLTYSTQPSNAAIGATIPLALRVQDASGNPVAGESIRLGFTANPGGATLTVDSNPVATDSNGIATFTGLSLDKPGNGYKLQATELTTKMKAAVSRAFNISSGAAASIGFSRQPATSLAGATIPLTATVRDAGGNPVLGDAVTLTIANNVGGAALSVAVNPVTTDANGQAVFSGVSLDKSGSGYTVQVSDASSPALTATSDPFAILTGPAASVTFSTQPTDAMAGAPIAVAAQIRDIAGNPVTGDPLTLSIEDNTGGATLSVTTNPVATDASGSAVFSGVSLNKIGAGYTLRVSDASTPARTATSSTFNITAGAAASVVFGTQPSNATVGATIPVTAKVLDANGNPVAGQNVRLGLSTNPGGATLTVAVNPVATDSNGVATFAGVSLNKTGTGYKLQATDLSTKLQAALSQGFNITSAPAARIAFTTQPANSAAGATIPLAVLVQDANDNPVAGDTVTLTLANNVGGSTLSVGANPVTTGADGIATFAGASLDKVGTGYTLQVRDASSPALIATSNPFNIQSGAPTRLTFSTQPGNALSGATIPVAALLQDANGNAVSGTAVTLALGNNPGGASLSVAANPVSTDASGMAAFSGVALNKAGSGYTLQVSAGGLNATSTGFDILASAAATLSFSTPPSNATAGATIPLAVKVVNASGNPLVGENIRIGFSSNPGGATLSVGVNPVATDSNGIATFSAVSLNKPGNGYTLQAIDLTTKSPVVVSNSFNIAVGAAASLSFSTQPKNSAAGAAIPVAVVAKDAAGNPVSGESLTLAIATNPGGSALSVGTNPVTTDASGTALFSGVSLNKVGVGYALKVSNAGTPALTKVSTTFDIAAGPAAAITFSTQPADATAGASIAVAAQVRDASGNPIAGDAVTLAIANNAGGSALSVASNPVTTDANGTATFSGVSLNKVGNGYTLQATDASSPALTATSNAFNVLSGVPSSLIFSTQPTSAAAGATIAVVARVRDVNGNPIAGDTVTLAIANNAAGSTLSVAANPVATDANGLATFAGVSLNKVGTGYTLQATDASTPALKRLSTAFNISAGTAATITFTTQPTTVGAGTAIGVAAQVQDANGNPIVGDAVTLSIANNPGNSTLSVTTNPVMTDSAGTATFSGVSLDKAGTGYALQVRDASSPALTATSNAFNILTGVPANLTFTTQPTDAAAGATISVAAQVRDTGGNPVTGDLLTLAIANNAGGAALSIGSNPVATDANGTATFSGVALNKAGTGYTLQVTDASTPALSKVSAPFNITVGAATTITFVTQPTDSVAGANIAIAAQVRDAGGNPVAGELLTLAIANNPGASTLSVTTNPVTTDASGVAVFSGVSLNKIGAGYTLKATDASTPALIATSNAFTVSAGAAAHLGFSTQPSNATSGATIPVVVLVQDANDNAVPGTVVSLALANNPAGATLSVAADPVTTDASGLAAFAGVALDKVGSGYTLKATAANNPALSATSNGFDIVASAAATLTFSTQPGNAVAGATIPVAVEVQDANGNPLAGENIKLGFSFNAGGATLKVDSNPVTTDRNGIARFSGVSLDKAGTGYTLQATDLSTKLPGLVSQRFNISSGPAASITFTTQPVNSLAGATIPLAALLQDANGNPVSGTAITLKLGNNPAGATLSVATNPVTTDANGSAVFPGVSLNKVGTAYTLQIVAGSLTATSNPFDIAAGSVHHLVFTKQPADVTRGGTLGLLEITEQDAAGNVVADNATVTFTVAGCGGSINLGTAAMNSGVAKFNPSARFYGPANGLVVSATAAGLTTGSTPFNVLGGSDLIFASGMESCRL